MQASLVGLIHPRLKPWCSVFDRTDRSQNKLPLILVENKFDLALFCDIVKGMKKIKENAGLLTVVLTALILAVAFFALLDKRFARMDERFVRMDERFARMDERMDERFARMEQNFKQDMQNFKHDLQVDIQGLREDIRAIQQALIKRKLAGTDDHK